MGAFIISPLPSVLIQACHQTAQRVEIRRSHPKVAMVLVRGGDNAVRTPIDLPILPPLTHSAEAALYGQFRRQDDGQHAERIAR